MPNTSEEIFPPTKLYHYTSIEALALILKSRKIRFTRADKVNDLEELIITDVQAIKKTVFISCWTATEYESIPLWNLYASKSKGVRIKLPPDMFKRGSAPYKSYQGNCHLINLMSLENTIKRGHVNQWIPYLFGPHRVNYDNGNSVSVLENGELRVDKVGTVKLNHWKFEEEHRFLIIPDALWNEQLKMFEYNEKFLSVPVAETKIDIPLDASRLDSIEITLGPAATKSEKYIVEALLERYTNNGKLKDSELKNRIRFR